MGTRSRPGQAGERGGGRAGPILAPLLAVFGEHSCTPVRVSEWGHTCHLRLWQD